MIVHLLYLLKNGHFEIIMEVVTGTHQVLLVVIVRLPFQKVKVVETKVNFYNFLLVVGTLYRNV